MKISLKWINEFVDVKEFFKEPDKLSFLLTNAGIEVEGTQDLAKNLNNVVVGHIKVYGKHPNADRLTLCQVDIGGGNIQQIVCGATNHKQGDKVVVALPGAVLPGDFAIKKSKIRDVESNGMLCSEKELGIAEDGAGIVILPAEAPVGTSFAEYMGYDDIIFELKVTPNRSDCLSHYGLAREIGCLLNKKLKEPEAKLKTRKQSTKKTITVELKDAERCPRYSGRAVFGVKVGPSPQWLKSRLEALGLKSISNVVDITNYILMELGQPLHAFDVAQIGQSKIIIDRSKKDEKFTTLDKTELVLTGEELVIRDGTKPVALAGVIGGLNSGITDKTENIFIESAYFLPQTVRRTSRKYGIETDSSYRFARGINPEGVVEALDRAAYLIQQVAGGEIAADHVDLYPKKFKKENIKIDIDAVSERLGYEAKEKDFASWMKRLNCDVTTTKSGVLNVLPPTYRWDLNIDMDLVEEYARLNGYDKIPETTPPLAHAPIHHDRQYTNEKRLTDYMRAEGYSDVVNYSFISEQFQNKILGSTDSFKALGLDVANQAVVITNPLSEDINVMRLSLVPGLFQTFLHNYRHGISFGRVFETGFTFKKSDTGYSEKFHLSLMAWGQKETVWQKNQQRLTVYDLKAAMENVLSKLQGANWHWRSLAQGQVPPFLHPGQAVGLFFEGQMLGYLGSVHPQLMEEYKIRGSVAIAEFDIEKLMRGQPRLPKIKKFSQVPFVERDLAFVIPQSVSSEDVAKEIKKSAGQLLQSIDVFDVYQGERLQPGTRSVAFRMVLQDNEGTLNDEQLQGLQQKIMATVQQKFSIQLRS